MMNSKEFDLNSLLILKAVIECKSVTAAAKKMAMSPSSVTYAINKIRKMTSNPIFTRSKNGITPTTLALELNKRYTKAIAMINSGLDFNDNAKSLEEYRSVTVSTYTILELWFSLFTYENNRRDGLSLNFVKHPASGEKRLSQLRNHEVDLDIGGLLPNDTSIISKKLFSSRFKVLVSKNHPTIKDTLTHADWERNEHIRWILPPDETIIQAGDANQVEELYNRKVGLSTGNALNAIMMCTMSDYIMLTPEYMEGFLTKYLPVRLFELPFETTMTSTVYAHFHRSARRKDFIGTCINALSKMGDPIPEDSR
ncbi:LysR family transcriptional regulator [Jejubacter calystegiae]|uniref:LysR family transcriptional regulator n=1 Tax=Jejubacter calystegiae TaxID=2579935 RepID=A0A4P8YH74_9ENTR|nr:LysR family transcriptional regulator [Jejubacter calystegiae]QCT18894.1 LysR family transcriptional regulator [Jejubacter calystegiae]